MQFGIQPLPPVYQHWANNSMDEDSQRAQIKRLHTQQTTMVDKEASKRTRNNPTPPQPSAITQPATSLFATTNNNETLTGILMGGQQEVWNDGAINEVEILLAGPDTSVDEQL